MSAQQVLAIYSESGGVTKTTTAVSLAVAVARGGRRVLLVDLDPRAAATRRIDVAPTGEGLHIGAILGNADPTGWATDLAVPAGAAWSANLSVIPAPAKSPTGRRAWRTTPTSGYAWPSKASTLTW